MTTVAFVFLTLFTWMVSSGSWLRLNHTGLSQDGHSEETKGCTSSASYKNTVVHETTTMTYDRSPELRDVSERIFKEDRVKKDCALFPGVTLSYMLFDGCVNLLQKVYVSKHVCRCKSQKLLVYFMYKTICLLLTIEIQADNHSTHLNYRSVHLGLDVICICEAFNLGAITLQDFLHKECGHVRSDFLISILSESQTSLKSSEESKKAHLRICCVQMPSHFCTPHCPREVFLTGDDIKFIADAIKEETVRPLEESRWAVRYFLAAVLLLGLYMTRIKVSPNRLSPAHGSYSTTVIFLTMTLRSFSQSLPAPQPSDWSQVAVGISVVVSCALRGTIHVLTAHRTAHTVIKLFGPTQLHFRTLPVTMLVLWLTFSPPFSNKSIKPCFEDKLQGSVGSAVRCSAVMGHLELLATLCCVVVSLCRLIQSLVTKWNFLSVLLHVTCLQNSRVLTKYVLIIKIKRLI